MKRRTEQFELDPNVDLKNYRFIGSELEALGERLDAARAALAGSTSDWARWYWQENLNRLLLQWQLKIGMYDGHGRDNSASQWNIDHGWLERDFYKDYGIADRLFDDLFRVNLSESWDRARQARLDRCNCV